MSDQQIIDILQNFDGILIQNDWFSIFIRWLGWWIIKGLSSLVNSIEGLIGDITGLTGFFDSPEIANLINSFKPVIFALLALSLAFVAYLIFFNKKFDKSAVPTNILLATMVILLLPIGMVKLNELTQAGINAVYGDFNSMAYEIIDNNMTDVYLYDDNNFSSKEVNPKNNVPRDQIHKVDINEPIDKSKTKNEKLFENEVVYKKDGGYEIDRIDGFFKWDNQYYRWKCNFWIIIVSLVATGVTLILTSIKIIRLLWELAFNKVFAIILAYADIANGQRLKKVIQNIISIFAVLFCMALMLKIYLIFSAWIGSKDLGLVGIFAMVGVSIAVIDGPNIVEQIFGIDAGLSSAWKTVAGMYAATRMGSELAKGVTKAGTGLAKFMTSAGSNLASGVSGGVGFGAGIKDGLRNNRLENQMNSDKDKSKKDNKANSLEHEMMKEGYDTNGDPLKGNKSNDESNKANQNLDKNQNDNSGKNNLKSDKLNGENNKNSALENEMKSSKIGDSATPTNDVKSGISNSNTPGQIDNINNGFGINDKSNDNEDIVGSESINGSEDISENAESLYRGNNSDIESLSDEIKSSDISSSDGDNGSITTADSIDQVSGLNNSSGLSNSSELSSNSNEAIGMSAKDTGSSSITSNAIDGITTEGIRRNSSNAGSLNSNGVETINADSGVIVSRSTLSDLSPEDISSKNISSGSQPLAGDGDISSVLGGVYGGAIASTVCSGITSDGLRSSSSNTSNPIREESIGANSINSGISSEGNISSEGTIASERSNINAGSINSNSSNNSNNNLNNDSSNPIRTESTGSSNIKPEKANTQQVEFNSQNKNNIIENRVISDVVREKVNSSAVGTIGTKVKRSYQIGKNTGERFIENKNNKKERKNK